MCNLVAEFNSKTILHSQLKTAIQAISNTHSMSGIVGTGMLLLGPSGVGKTRILENYTKTYLDKQSDLETKTLTKKPILSIRIPASPTPKAIIEKLLTAAGHPFVTSSTQSVLENRLSAVIKNQHVSLIIFDEFQHMLRAQAQKSTRAVLNFIKVLMDENQIAIVMSGTPESLGSIREHEELYQRFTHEHITLRPFKLGSREEISIFSSYLSVCEHILNDLGVNSISLTSEINLARIYLATDGKPRLINRLIVKAIQRAPNKENLTLIDFALANTNPPLNPKLGKFNPFQAQSEALKKRLKES
ncbi:MULTISPECIES: TniB family NTP-binding protein [unclassified Marinobacterium]|uniref:TniB family NTP-binding protein n=1 Tax=unclassified Marinobacterium TaxID=2644139 RepID=UPI001568E2B0|nr:MULTISPECIES: TniB family NTP-binding protein [unclassified Marinobacterium]NRP10112.1 Bacterial TniB protein [Marinobacterium sp. xm-g-48]NRP83211.1 Bacterial TniB protein [Marinobacterium sp. xm-d-509]